MTPEQLTTLRVGLRMCRALSESFGQEPDQAVELGEILIAEVDRLNRLLGDSFRITESLTRKLNDTQKALTEARLTAEEAWGDQ